MSYIDIDPSEMHQFFTLRGYRKVRFPGSNEDAYVIYSTDRTLMIRIYTSLEGGVQREKGSDAIRCQLIETSTRQAVWNMTHTKRLDTWRENLLQKLVLLENVFHRDKHCPKCDNLLVPRASQGGKNVFWACLAYHKTGCTGGESMELGLKKRFLSFRQAP